MTFEEPGVTDLLATAKVTGVVDDAESGRSRLL
jgi:hypothetical protein